MKILILLCILLSGCSIHYHNSKGIKANASDIKTKVGNIKSTKMDFESTLDIWIPWRPNVSD